MSLTNGQTVRWTKETPWVVEEVKETTAIIYNGVTTHEVPLDELVVKDPTAPVRVVVENGYYTSDRPVEIVDVIGDQDVIERAIRYPEGPGPVPLAFLPDNFDDTDVEAACLCSKLSAHVRPDYVEQYHTFVNDTQRRDEYTRKVQAEWIKEVLGE